MIRAPSASAERKIVARKIFWFDGAQSPEVPMSKRLLIICTLCALVGLLVLPINPVHRRAYQLVTLGFLFGAWAGLTLLLWNRKPLRFIALMIPALLGILFVLPGRAYHTEKLREEYLRRLNQFENVRYFWGGESARGIDCSGLPRRALRDALFAHGIRHANGRALRAFAEQWWFDTSAAALGEGYRGYTQPLGVEGTIKSMSYDNLLPGDLAVTQDGLHVLVYMGQEQWIQADPGRGHVSTEHGRHSDNVWFGAKVSMHRWQAFMVPPK